MKKRYRNTAFLVELVINILVFSVSCAILVALFAQAALDSRETRTTAAAAAEVQNVVETVKARGSQGVDGLFGGGGGFPTGQGMVLYDESWRPNASPGVAAYVITVTETHTPTAAGTLIYIDAAAYVYTSPNEVGAEPLYALSTATYLPSEGGSAA